MTSSGFQSFTTPRDTFVSQSTQPAINTQDGLSQIAQTLSVIEPTLQKYIVKKIEDIKEEDVAEAQTAGAKSARTYTQVEKLLFPETVELDETSKAYATSLAALKKTQQQQDIEITRGKSIWFKNAYEEAKAITLGKNFKSEISSDYQTYRVPDSVTGEMKPLSAYPFQSAEVQNFLGQYRNKNVEAANISEFYFNRSFLPQIEEGVKDFAKDHDKDHAFFKLEEYKKTVKEDLGLIYFSYIRNVTTANKENREPNLEQEANDIKNLVENITQIYQAEDLSKFYDEVLIPFITERGVLMASMTELGDERFDMAIDFLQQFPNLFPRKLKTKTEVINGEVVVSPILDKDGQPEYFTNNVLQNKKDYEKKINAAIKSINALRIQNQKINSPRELNLKKKEMKDLLLLPNPTEEQRKRILEIASSDPKALTWLKNNRDTYRVYSEEGYNQLLFELEGGKIRNEELAYTKINEWYANTLKLPKDQDRKDKLIGLIDREVNEERNYANTTATRIIQGKSLYLQNIISSKGTDDMKIVDQITETIESVRTKLVDYSVTKRVFVEGEAPRYPTLQEIDNYGEELRQAMESRLTAIQKFVSDDTGINPTINVLSPDYKNQERLLARTQIFEITKNVVGKQTIGADGNRTKPTLEDIELSYDFVVEDVNAQFLINQFYNEDGSQTSGQKEQLAQFLNQLDISKEDIEKYNLVKVFNDIGFDITKNYPSFTKTINEYNAQVVPPDNSGGETTDVNDLSGTQGQNMESQPDFRGAGNNKQFVQEQEQGEVDENVQNSTVSDETKVKTTGGLNLSKVISDIFMPPVNASENDLLASGDVPPPVGAGENFMNRFNMYLQTAYGFDTDSAIYKNMPNYMKTNLMGSFQDEQAAEIAEKETEQPTTTVGDFLPSQDLSEVRSDVTPNLGLRDGSLIAMAFPLEGRKIGEQTDTKVVINKEPSGVKRMEANFPVIYKLAKEVGIKFPEIVAAQFSVESDHGLSVTGKNNYFGIKATQSEIDAGQSTLAPTFEEINGKKVRVMAHFKNFESIRESLEHYKKFWNDNYLDRKGISTVDTVEKAVKLLKDNGYATDSDYIKLVLEVIRDAQREPPLY